MCLQNKKPDRLVGEPCAIRRGLTRRRYPDQLLYLRLLPHQVGQGDAGQQLIHPLLEGMPHRPDAAGAPGATSIGIDWPRIAVYLEGLVLRGCHDVADRNDVRLPREVVPTFGTAHAQNQSRAPKTQEDLLDIVGWKALGVGKLTRGTGPLPFRPRLARWIEMMRLYSVQVVTRMVGIWGGDRLESMWESGVISRELESGVTRKSLRPPRYAQLSG